MHGAVSISSLKSIYIFFWRVCGPWWRLERRGPRWCGLPRSSLLSPLTAAMQPFPSWCPLPLRPLLVCLSPVCVGVWVWVCVCVGGCEREAEGGGTVIQAAHQPPASSCPNSTHQTHRHRIFFLLLLTVFGFFLLLIMFYVDLYVSAFRLVPTFFFFAFLPPGSFYFQLSSASLPPPYTLSFSVYYYISLQVRQRQRKKTDPVLSGFCLSCVCELVQA